MTKYVQGDDGTMVRTLTLQEGTDCLINVYQNGTKVHEKTLPVGTDGLGMFYDYDVTGGTYENPRYAQISEDASSVADELYDASGKKWIFDHTRLETEYVWRDNNHPSMHISGDYRKDQADGLFYSESEILGEYRWSGYPNGYWYEGAWHNGNEYNRFLEFYVYNIYKQAGFLKINKAVTINGRAPSTDEEKKALAGTYTFTVYTDEECTIPYKVESGSEWVPLVLTVLIGEDGAGRSSETVSVPTGIYWIKETLPGNSAEPVADVVRVEVRANTTQENPAAADFTNNIDFGTLKMTKKVSGAYTAGANETYPVCLMRDGK